MDETGKATAEALVDGRDALFVLLVRPNPEDPGKVRPEMHDHGLGAQNVIAVLRMLADSIEKQTAAAKDHDGS